MRRFLLSFPNRWKSCEKKTEIASTGLRLEVVSDREVNHVHLVVLGRALILSTALETRNSRCKNPPHDHWWCIPRPVCKSSKVHPSLCICRWTAQIWTTFPLANVHPLPNQALILFLHGRFVKIQHRSELPRDSKSTWSSAKRVKASQMLEEGGSWKLYQIQNAILLVFLAWRRWWFRSCIWVWVKITLPPLQKNRTGNGEKIHRKLHQFASIFAIGKSAILTQQTFR